MLPTQRELRGSQQSIARQETHPSRKAGRHALGFLALMGVLVVLIAGCVVSPPPSTTSFHHTPNAPNTGKSLLYLSAPNDPNDRVVTLLTMLRTSDGATLWQYALPGFLSTGPVSVLGVALDRGAINIVNGVVYFVVNPSLPDALGGDPWDPNRWDPNGQQTLTALRATDGAVLWQQPVKALMVELLGVSDGVVCVNTIRRDASLKFLSALYGYSASTGARVWQRDSGGIASTLVDPYPSSLVDGILYAAGSVSASGNSTTRPSFTLEALQVSTGQTLWQSSLPMNTPPGAFSSETPIFGKDGVAIRVSESLISTPANLDASLSGIQESTGKTLWRYQLPSLIPFLPFSDPLRFALFESDGALDFVTTAADGSNSLTSLRMSDGKPLWRQPLTTDKRDFWNMAVSDDGVYTVNALPFTGVHPTFNDITLVANDAQSGSPRWQYQPGTNDYIAIGVTRDAVFAESAGTLTGLRPSDGTVLWQRTIPGQLTTVGDMGILSYASSSTLPQTQTVCGVQPDTGAQQWCSQFTTGLYAIVPGP